MIQFPIGTCLVRYPITELDGTTLAAGTFPLAIDNEWINSFADLVAHPFYGSVGTWTFDDAADRLELIPCGRAVDRLVTEVDLSLAAWGTDDDGAWLSEGGGLWLLEESTP